MVSHKKRVGLRHADYFEVGDGAGFTSSAALFWLIPSQGGSRAAVRGKPSVQRAVTRDAASKFWCKELINSATLMCLIHNVLFIYGEVIPTTEIMKS